MGAEIHICLESDKYNERELAPFLGRDFQSEITRGTIWRNKKPFLNDEEIKILEAPYYEEFEDESVRLTNPDELIIVLKKVKEYLKKNKDILPFEIGIDFDKMKKLGLNQELIVSGSRCWIKGDSLYYDVSETFQIVNYPKEPNEINLTIEYSEEVDINNKKFFLKKESRFEKFADTIDQVIEFCQMAYENNEKIYWLFSH